MNVHWTHHAATRAAEMEVSREEVELAIKEAVITYPNALGHPDGKTFVGGRLAVPVTEDGAILTVLWHRAAGREEGQP